MPGFSGFWGFRDLRAIHSQLKVNGPKSKRVRLNITHARTITWCSVIVLFKLFKGS